MQNLRDDANKPGMLRPAFQSVVLWTSAIAWLAVVVLSAPGPAVGADYLWWEGEATEATNFPRQSWFSPSTFVETADQLSGGDWLSISGNRGKDEVFARYVVEVRAAGAYSLWARKFWKHGPFRWRFDNGAWQTCGEDVALADSTYLRQHLGANWVFLGKVNLKPGRRRFELRLLAGEGEATTACFDCFLLTQGVFVPRGKLKPDERSGLAAEGWFAYEPVEAVAGAESLLDLRPLNETEAGVHGFVGRKGKDFVLGDGTPVRFWGVNAGPNVVDQGHDLVDLLAGRLARFGVNAVRYHGPIFDASGDPARADAARLDNVFYLVAALRRQGIYKNLSVYFPLWFPVRPDYGIEGYADSGDRIPFALLYFDKRMQEIHRAWLRQLLTTRNPYTGRTLARETAVASVEIVNEDSLFFWTFTRKNVPEVHWRRLEGLFGAWLVRRHGSIEKALAAWGGAGMPEDSPREGRAGIHEAWHMTSAAINQADDAKRRRISDQVRFLTELQRGYYEQTVDYIKKELGYGGLVSCSNWQVSDPATLDALERYTYTAGDLIDRHGYFGGEHEGQGAAWSVGVGHTWKDAAAVSAPAGLPLQFLQTGDLPHTITEIGWPSPNRYRADCTLLAAAYGALQGLDGLYWFAVGDNSLCDTGMNKFAVGVPTVYGSFPAAALAYRRGDIAEAEEVAGWTLRLDDLYAMAGGAAAAPALDALRAADVPRDAKQPGHEGRVDPAWFYIGRLVRRFGDKPSAQVRPGLESLMDPAGGRMRSVTGQLDWRVGMAVTVDTPRAAAVAGFLAKAGETSLAGGRVRIVSGNEYGAVWVIALDGRPLAESARILVQAVTEEQPFGFASDGGRITNLGGWPQNVRRIDVTVMFGGDLAKPCRVVTLDENGFVRHSDARQPEESSQGAVLTVKPASDTLYTVILR